MKIYRLIIIVTTFVWTILAGDAFSASKDELMELEAKDVPAIELKLKLEANKSLHLRNLGRYYFKADNLNEARKCGVRLLEIAKEKDDRDFSEMWGRYILGAVETAEGDTQNAIMNLEIARSIAEAQSDNYALSLIYNSLGLHYMFNNNDPFTATNYYYQSIEAARKEKNLRLEAPLLANLAAAYFTMEDPSGLRLAEQAVELSEKFDSSFTIKPRIILAQTYILADSTAKARKILEKIHSNESKTVRKNFDSTLKYLEAMLNEKEGFEDEAIATYRDMLKTEGGDPSWVASISLSLATALEKKRQFSEAIEILENALSNSRKSNVHIHSSRVMKTLIRMYANAGLKNKAIAMGEEYMAYSDSIYTIGHHKTLQENRIRHEVYTKQREIDEQKILLSSKSHKILVLAIVIGLLSMLLIIVFYSIRKRERLYKTIVARNSEFLLRDKQQAEEIEMLRQKIDQNIDQHTPSTSADKTFKSEDEANKELMERFTSLMENNAGYADPHITIASVAKVLGTNRTYLSKAINAATGKTFLQTINEYRMRHAVEVISDKSSDIPLKQLAADLGYNSMSTFYTSFNNYTGMTPAKYREQVRRYSEEINTKQPES